MSQSGFPRAGNYVTSNRFYSEMIPDASIVACFTECSGLSIKVDYETYMEGRDNEQQRIFLKHRSISRASQLFATQIFSSQSSSFGDRRNG